MDRRDTVDAKRREVRFVEGVKLSMVSDKCHTCCACSRQNHYFLRLALNAFRGPPTTMANLNNKKKKQIKEYQSTLHLSRALSKIGGAASRRILPG